MREIKNSKKLITASGKKSYEFCDDCNKQGKTKHYGKGVFQSDLCDECSKIPSEIIEPKTLPLYIKGKYICQVEYRNGNSLNFPYITKDGKYKESKLYKGRKYGHICYIKYL